MNHRRTLLAAALLGGTGVLFGAFGAHLLHARLVTQGTAEVWSTAVLYQLVHAAALAGLAAWMRVSSGADSGDRGRSAAQWTARLWTAGTVLFSGSLYLLALGGPRILGPVTPAGGSLMIGGWIALAATAIG